MQIQEEGDVVLNCVLAGDVESLRRHCETISVVDAAGEDAGSQEEESDVFRYKDEAGRNALFVASMLGRSHVVRELLLKNGALHVNKPSTRGYTPLHCAACWGHLETVVTLLELGADIQAENFRQERPLEVAMRYSHTACADCLMVAEAKQDFVFYINYIRDIISDPEKIQGKLNKEDKNLCSNTCSAKSDWVQHAKNPAATDFTAQRKHMEDTLQPVLSKLSAAVVCPPAKAPKKV